MKPIGTSILNLGRVVVLPMVGLVMAGQVHAQEEDDPFLEEIVVIETKSRGEQDVMDIPVAVTAITGAVIQEGVLKDMFDLQQNVPGLIVGRSQTATTSNFAIRGVGSTSNNFGVESSVGLYVDGVYRSRQSSMINELIDVQTVSVLRGPQGTLFGKNTASGAINIATVAPNFDTNDAFLEYTTGNYGLSRIAGAANVVLTDNLAFRGTVFSSQRDGYVTEDNFQGFFPQSGRIEDAYNDRDRFGARLQVAYDNQDDFDMRIIADYSKIDEVCCVALSRVDSLFSHGGVEAGQYVPGPDAIRSLLTSVDYGTLWDTTYTDFNYGIDLPPWVVQGVGFDDYRTSLNRAPASSNEDRGISLEFNKAWGDTVLTWITGYRAFDTYDDIDADFTDTLIIDRINDAEQNSLSQEIRLAGQFGESSNWVIGGYYFGQEITQHTDTYGLADLQTFVDLGLDATGSPLTLSDITNAVTAYALFDQNFLGGDFPLGVPAFPDGIYANDIVIQDHSGYAVFGQVDWDINDSWTISLGARYTDETKDIDATYTQTHPADPFFQNAPDLETIGLTLFLIDQWIQGGADPALRPDDTPLLAVAGENVGWGGYQFAPLAPRGDVRETLEDDQVTGSAKISWFANDSTMFYVSYSTGFKAGGTNADRIYPFFDQVFGPETSTSIELGYKGTIGDAMQLKVAAYNTVFEDFQANSFTGTGFNLQNAGEMEISGLEIEYLWRVMDNTTINGYFAYNQGEFNSFTGGTCWDAYPFHTGTQDPGLPASGNPPCDRTGEDIPYNPRDRAQIGIDQIIPMGNNEMFIRLDYVWASEQTTDGDNDPLTTQDDLGLLNMRVGMNIDAWNASVTLWGRNITDERYYSGSFDPPLLDNGRMNSYPAEPATYGLTIRKNWD